MNRILFWSIVGVSLVASSVAADARSKRYRPYPGYWQEIDRDHRNRRDARRAGVVAAIVVSGVTKSVAEDRIENRYQECLRNNGYYDVDCDRQRYRDENRARRDARRRGLVAGVITREVVRN